MKYLKSYKVFELLTDIPTWKSEDEMNQDIDSIKSMFGDISDDGHNVEVSHSKVFDASTILIEIVEMSYPEHEHPQAWQTGDSKFKEITWGSIKGDIYQVLDAMSDKYEFIKIELLSMKDEFFLYTVRELKEAEGEMFNDNTNFTNINIYLSLK